MNLKALTNQALDLKVISLAKKEKELLAETIIHVAEVERRKLYREFNITSLYNYLTDHAGFSNGSAYRLMDAARLQLEVPDLAKKIEAGKINMTQVRLVQEASRQREKEDRTKAVEPLRGLKAADDNQWVQSEQGNLLDFIHPSTLSDSNMNLIGGSDAGSGNSKDSLQSAELKSERPEKVDVLEAIQGLTASESEKIVSQSFELKVKKPLKVTRQKDGSVLVQMSFTAEQWAEIERVKEATSSSLPTGSYPEVITHLAFKENLKRAKEAKPRPSTTALTPAKKKSVLRRDQCCQFRDPRSGNICGSRFNLQVDHIKPRWAGGLHELSNLQVLCAAHNRMKYEKEAGIRRC
jgi:hypothetical protein